MSTVLVDANVLIDVASQDPRWSGWSAEALARAAHGAALVVNPIIYAEVSTIYASIEEIELALPASIYRRDPLPYDAGFLAGKAFVRYKRAGGKRTSPLPDFYIGAHAAVAGYALLTRDATRYRSYFPTVELIAP